MLTTQIDRREALGGIAAIFGAALISPLQTAIAEGVDPGMGPQNTIFTDGQRALLDALCERILPTTDTPGARDAGVTDYIEMIVDECVRGLGEISRKAGIPIINEILPVTDIAQADARAGNDEFNKGIEAAAAAIEIIAWRRGLN